MKTQPAKAIWPTWMKTDVEAVALIAMASDLTHVSPVMWAGTVLYWFPLPHVLQAVLELTV